MKIAEFYMNVLFMCHNRNLAVRNNLICGSILDVKIPKLSSGILLEFDIRLRLFKNNQGPVDLGSKALDLDPTNPKLLDPNPRKKLEIQNPNPR